MQRKRETRANACIDELQGVLVAFEKLKSGINI
jgi:hypothetical protein